MNYVFSTFILPPGWAIKKHELYFELATLAYHSLTIQLISKAHVKTREHRLYLLELS